MNDGSVLFQLTAHFLMLSLLAIGGANAVVPDMHRLVVEANHWMTSTEFTQLFAIAQAAPGPNVLVVSLIGWKVAGVTGALATTAAMCGPSSVLAYWVAGLWRRFRLSPWCTAIRNGLAPITVGLVLASGYLLARAADPNWAAGAVTVVTVVLALKTRWNPLWLLMGGAVAGLLGWVQG